MFTAVSDKRKCSPAQDRRLTFHMLRQQRKSCSMSDLTDDLEPSSASPQLTRPAQFSPATQKRVQLKRLYSREAELRTVGEGGVWVSLTDTASENDSDNGLLDVIRTHPKLSSPLKEKLFSFVVHEKSDSDDKKIQESHKTETVTDETVTSFFI